MTRRLIALTLFILIGYGLIEAWPLLAGPSLSITSPINNMPYPDGIVSVQGTVMRTASLTLNGAPISHDQNGNFSSTLTFPRGGSILTFVATDRFGRSVTATRSIFVPLVNNQSETNN
ncbi:hypothetical protein EXS57_00215 [Candidatus Kaiserbacteria bacterium]|nr:hypothetical protein [Candidatus Kaiserbacteria bacterium]